MTDSGKYMGECFLCRAAVPKAQVTRHLKACLQKRVAEAGKPVKLFQLAVEGRYRPQYWMQVEIPGAWTLDDLNLFLRRTWLECCGHMSGFTIAGEQYSSEPNENLLFGRREQSMDVRLYRALAAGAKFAYEYDYGSTTHLALRVVGAHEAPWTGKAVRILARNAPPVFQCAECSAVATQLDASDGGLYPDRCYCDACAKKADDEGGMWRPIVNSPRVGVCGYCGEKNTAGLS